MKASAKLTDPRPFYYHAPSDRVLYLAAGRCPFIFTITLADLRTHDADVSQGPVMRQAIHPFGSSTAVGSLADDGARRGLADTSVLMLEDLEATLTLWADFCDAVVEQLNEGAALSEALATTWTLPSDEVAA